MGEKIYPEGIGKYNGNTKIILRERHRSINIQYLCYDDVIVNWKITLIFAFHKLSYSDP